ncbi:hypothetical protein [Shewanella ulleungensis]|uniref:CR-type domain-containing protein n=1 Tax=Shewanella ulleungensis TaxID=2282699 RepID=A0ABQ2QHA8_9GAMM|nr:hypothetical protein [Shewanella ulleungensis]MCL1149394.1 hypothetical protein [Shewanella ulleungensis]GGP78861.1 hypothetical protein GCM10009410_08930 [Shewanella ulleungensis]
MSKLEQFQRFIRSNGKNLTGVDVPVVLSNEQTKLPQLKFTFGWTIEVGVSQHEHGSYCPNGIKSGSASNARDYAHDKAKEYASGQNSLFNDRFLNILGPDISDNFLIRNRDLQSAPETYVGSKTCYNCSGSGSQSCSNCHGSGKNSCSGCHGSGRVSVSRFDSYNNRTVYTTESCSTCWGSGKKTCYTCNGSGSLTCNTCNGGGYLYYSYTIDGDAKRSTKWAYNSNDYHEWTSEFVKNNGLDLVYHLIEITEVDVEGTLGGCTFIYAFTAKLPTLQFTATVDKVDTTMCFAGKKDTTHNAGGVYDPAVWLVAQKMTGNDQETDKEVLATPAIKDIVEAHTTKTQIALLTENWVSKEISDAVISNYQHLVTKLKKQSIKGIAPNMFLSFIKYTYFFFTLGMLIALLFPSFAAETSHRMSVTQVPEWIVALLMMKFGLFELPAYVNYVFFFGLLWLSYKSVKKWYWKSIGKAKVWLLAISITLLLPHIAFSFYYNTLELLRHSPAIANTLVSGSLLVGIYLLIWGMKKPKRWYGKLFGLLAGLGIYCAIQYGLYAINPTYGFVVDHAHYAREVTKLLTSALDFMKHNIFEWGLLSISFTYFLTRRRFWLKAKTMVADYDSPVLLKSMNMDK